MNFNEQEITHAIHSTLENLTSNFTPSKIQNQLDALLNEIQQAYCLAILQNKKEIIKKILEKQQIEDIKIDSEKEELESTINSARKTLLMTDTRIQKEKKKIADLQTEVNDLSQACASKRRAMKNFRLLRQNITYAHYTPKKDEAILEQMEKQLQFNKEQLEQLQADHQKTLNNRSQANQFLSLKATETKKREERIKQNHLLSEQESIDCSKVLSEENLANLNEKLSNSNSQITKLLRSYGPVQIMELWITHIAKKNHSPNQHHIITALNTVRIHYLILETQAAISIKNNELALEIEAIEKLQDKGKQFNIALQKIQDDQETLKNLRKHTSQLKNIRTFISSALISLFMLTTIFLLLKIVTIALILLCTFLLSALAKYKVNQLLVQNNKTENAIPSSEDNTADIHQNLEKLKIEFTVHETKIKKINKELTKLNKTLETYQKPTDDHQSEKNLQRSHRMPTKLIGLVRNSLFSPPRVSSNETISSDNLTPLTPPFRN